MGILKIKTKIYVQQVSQKINLPGFIKSKLLNSEDFSGKLENWMMEGKVNAEIVDGKLFFDSLDTEIKNPKENILWKVSVQSPYILELDYQYVTNYRQFVYDILERRSSKWQ